MADSETISLTEQVELLKQQLAQAQRLTALGELLGTTTHEFNNVLMTIINYAKLGLRQRDAESRDKAFDKILAAGNRAARITNGILALARNRAQGQEPTALAGLVEDTLVILESELRKYRIAVETRLAEVPRAMVHANQIQQVLLNLVINARQAMPNGGQLLVKLAHEPGSEFVDLTIRDTGSGIPADKLPQIFDRFYTTKRGPDETGKGGSGLGLAFCKDVIEAHRGRIRVESTPGAGTAFTLRLPVARSVASPAAPAEVPAQAAAPPVAPVAPALPVPPVASLPTAPPATTPPAAPAAFR